MQIERRVAVVIVVPAHPRTFVVDQFRGSGEIFSGKPEELFDMMFRNIPLLVDFMENGIELEPFVVDVEPVDFVRIAFRDSGDMPLIFVQQTELVARQPLRHQRMPDHRVSFGVKTVRFAELDDFIRRGTAIDVRAPLLLAERAALRFVGVPVERNNRLVEKPGELFSVDFVFPRLFAAELVQHEGVCAEAEFVSAKFVMDRRPLDGFAVRCKNREFQRPLARGLGGATDARIEFRGICQKFGQSFLSGFGKSSHFNTPYFSVTSSKNGVGPCFSFAMSNASLHPSGERSSGISSIRSPVRLSA